MDFDSIACISNLDRRIAMLGASTGDVVANWQLRRAGVGRDSVARRVDQGFMRRVGPHEFLVGHAAARPMSDRSRRGLAIVHAGPRGAALTRGSAAAQLGLLDRGDGTIHAVVTHAVRDLPRYRIVYHRARDFSMQDAIWVAGEPSTDPTRTIVDLGHDHTRYQVVRAMCEARDRDRLDLGRVGSLLRARSGHPGTAEVRMALALLEEGCNGTRGRAEDRLLAGVMRSRILPTPDVCNRKRMGIAGIEPDLAWLGVGLVVFADGRPHSWEDVREKDAQEMVILRDHGITPLRFDNRQIWSRLPAVVAAIEDAYVACRRRSSSRVPGQSRPLALQASL